jgi:CRISPR/Cas system CSM-associated protein Csm2 small subunit
MDAIIRMNFGDAHSIPSIIGKNTDELIQIFTYMRYDIYYKYGRDSDESVDTFVARMDVHIKICDTAIADLEKIAARQN